jgi:sporulation protein YlmC with PRC-barrel domain
MTERSALPQAGMPRRNMSRFADDFVATTGTAAEGGPFLGEPGTFKPDEELDMKKTLMLGAAALALAVAAPSFAQDRTPPGAPGTKPPATQANRPADKAMQERMARLSAAQPAQQLAVSGDALIGTEIRNTQDQKIGSVKDIILTDGKITAIVVGRGGVLGMGTDYHQVEFAQVKMTADMETVVLDLAEDQVKALPKLAFEKGKWGPVPAKADRATPPARTAPGAPPSRGTDTAPKTDIKKDEAPKTDSPAPAPKDQ